MRAAHRGPGPTRASWLRQRSSAAVPARERVPRSTSGSTGRDQARDESGCDVRGHEIGGWLHSHSAHRRPTRPLRRPTDVAQSKYYTTRSGSSYVLVSRCVTATGAARVPASADGAKIADARCSWTADDNPRPSRSDLYTLVPCRQVVAWPTLLRPQSPATLCALTPTGLGVCAPPSADRGRRVRRRADRPLIRSRRPAGRRSGNVHKFVTCTRNDDDVRYPPSTKLDPRCRRRLLSNLPLPHVRRGCIKVGAAVGD